MPVSASQRDALAELLWSGRNALPVLDGDGRPLGRVTLERLLRKAERPA
jgi:osmoprotectant transport system ATP-binding protein